jgi:hypothetical protein
MVTDSIIQFSEKNPFDRKAFKIYISLHRPTIFKLRKSFSKMRMKTLKATSMFTWGGIRKKLDNLDKATELGSRVITAFSHFINYEWTFETNIMNSMMQDMSPEERDEFDIDMGYLSWK